MYSTTVLIWNTTLSVVACCLFSNSTRTGRLEHKTPSKNKLIQQTTETSSMLLVSVFYSYVVTTTVDFCLKGYNKHK